MNENTSPTFVGNKYRITVLSEMLIRFEYSETGEFFDGQSSLVRNRVFPSCAVEVNDTGSDLILTSKYFTMQYVKDKSFFGSKMFPDSNLRVKLNETDKIWFPTNAEVRNFKSNKFSFDSNTKNYKSLYSTDGYVMIDDTDGLVFDANGYLRKRTTKNVDMYLFVYRRDFALCLQDFFRLTGFPPMIPKYALGIWWNRERVYNAYDSHLLIDLFDKYDIPISVFLLSEFWHLENLKNPVYKKSGYSFSNELFPEPEKFIDSMHEKNIKVGLNFDPSEGITPHDQEVYPYFNDKDNNIIKFNIFDKEFAKIFFENILKRLNNVDFLWNDYDKDIDSLIALNNLLIKAKDKNRFLTLTRNSGLGSHTSPVLYSGKTTVSWKTLSMLPEYNAGASNYGVSWWSHDVGGYQDGIEESELYLRYVQFSTFSPIFRFSAKRGAYYKREPWLWDIKTMTIAKSYCDLRYRLIPYIYSEGYHYSSTGAPLCMPLYYTNPEIYDELDYRNHYKFGSQLLIAPITKPMNNLISRSIHKVFLPKGTWYDYKSGKKFFGNKRYVTFYKEEDYPFFVKEGGIVPLKIFDSKKNDLNNPRSLEINIFPGKSNIYRLYEDDGESLDYKDGKFCTTVFDYNYMKNNYTLIIRPVDGISRIIPDLRNYVIKFRNVKMADDVELFLNGGRFTNFTATVQENDFVIEIKDVPTSRQLTINCRGKDIEIDASRILNDDINSIIFDLKIETSLKESLASIIFGDSELRAKRIAIKKLKSKGLHPKFISMFLKLLEYNS